MQAVIIHDIREWSIEDVPRPSPGPGEVLVAVSRVQLSFTECELFDGVESSHYEAFRERISDGGARAFGHEFCGVVVEAGGDVETLAVGDRVFAPGKITCGSCSYCERDYPQYCENVQIIGRHRPGALAEYVAVPEQPLCRLPSAVSDAEGAALQPIASSLLSVHDTGVGTGDVVVALGTGVMGFSCAQFALHHGARTVVAVDVDPQKLEIAESRGLTPVDPRETDPVAFVEDLTGGVGADYVFEAVGGDQDRMTGGSGPLSQAFAMVRRGGTVVQIGHITSEITVDPRALRSRGVSWVQPLSNVVPVGPNATTGELAAEMLATDRVAIEPYITHELAGLDAFEEAVDVTLHKAEHGAMHPAQLVLD